jgi:hypothetical protein
MTTEEKRSARQRQLEAERQARTIDEFCRRNHIARDTAYKEIRNGRLIARKVGKKTLIFDVDEAAWRAALPVLELSA